ncbi:MAG: hypothetical protein IPL96_07750 [Holophagaceae bacterium]|nr:hypothetical protein [Holophagaceae bacterium]
MKLEGSISESSKDFVRLDPGLPSGKVRSMVYRKEENFSHAAKAFLALVREREIPKESRARRR